VTQAGNSYFYPRTYEYVLNNVKANFRIVREYWYWIPSFSYACNFITASEILDPARLGSDEVNKIILGRGLKLRLYSGGLHASLFMSKVLKSSFINE